MDHLFKFSFSLPLCGNIKKKEKKDGLFGCSLIKLVQSVEGKFRVRVLLVGVTNTLIQALSTFFFFFLVSFIFFRFWNGFLSFGFTWGDRNATLCMP